jgi:hypothetical protein
MDLMELAHRKGYCGGNTAKLLQQSAGVNGEYRGGG